MMMKKIFGGVLLMVLAVNAHAESAQYQAAQTAKGQIGEYMYKFGLLTNSFTEKGHANANIKEELAEKTTQRIDQLVANGLKEDKSCDSIAYYLSTTLKNGFDDLMKKNGEPSEPAKRAYQGYIDASTVYAQSQCYYLSE